MSRKDPDGMNNVLFFFDENGFHVSLVQIENNVQKLRK
jgi:hypothetical protein